MSEKQLLRIKRAHIALMKHPETALYSGVMLMGNTKVEPGAFTAYTDGINKKYSSVFLETIDSESQCRGLVLHENLHVALKQVAHGMSMFKENPQLANLAADFVVNDIIENIKGTVAGSNNERIVELPNGAAYDEMFHNWSMREVYNYLKDKCKGGKKPKPNGNPGNGSSSGNDPLNGGGQNKPNKNDPVEVNGKQHSTLDEHDFDEMVNASPEQLKEANEAIDRALREGGILAGRMGAKMPRVIAELLEPKIDWKEALREFVSSSTRGSDEFTWRKLNKRHIANDIILPNIENETIGEIIVAIDTSGSIGREQLTEFATELASICDLCSPETVRVLWWDTTVHGEQLFTHDYSKLVSMLKPLGGGGTKVSCVSEYIQKESLKPECVLVFTDGYVEGDIKWHVTSPTLWMITENKDLDVPVGKKVIFNRD